MAETAARYAVYFAPPAGSEHDRVGSRWLGRDARSGAALAQPAVPGLEPARLAALTAAPRRYGLHATLKPPFRLHPETDFGQLDAALAALATTLPPVRFRAGLARLDGFVAWRPLEAHGVLSEIAAACVTELDCLRTPAPEEEVARRRRNGLGARQDELLRRWGYPYVLDEFRFHLSLSERLDDEDTPRVLEALARECNGLEEEPLLFDALALFVQAEEGGDFRHVRSYGFDGSTGDPGEEIP